MRSPDDAALELGQGRKAVEDQLAASRGGIDGLGERAQADVTFGNTLDGLDQLLEGVGEAVQMGYSGFR